MGGTQTAIVSVLDVTEHPEFQTFKASLPIIQAPIVAPPREIKKVRVSQLHCIAGGKRARILLDSQSA
jgi:hypothetical protein